LKLKANSKILELGSGTGMVAMAFGLLFQPLKVIMTDLPHTVGIIEEALELNNWLKKTRTSYEVQGLCWGIKHKKVLQ
jgi:methylase of polypeptide subunit release factors